MKRLLYILPALMLLFGACNDDKDLPNVDFTVNYDGATDVDGVLYVVQGTELQFTSIGVKAVNPNHNAVIASASYYWDFLQAGTTIVEPFGRGFDTGLYQLGDHQVQINLSVLEEGCTPATAVLTFPVKIVADQSDIPPVDADEGPLTPEAVITAAD